MMSLDQVAASCRDHAMTTFQLHDQLTEVIWNLEQDPATFNGGVHRDYLLTSLREVLQYLTHERDTAHAAWVEADQQADSSARLRGEV